MLHIYKLSIKPISPNSVDDIYGYLELYNGHPGYSLYGVATTHGALNQLIGRYVVELNMDTDDVEALVIEDNHGNVCDFLYLNKTKSCRGLEWSPDHPDFLDFVDEYYHGDAEDLSWTDFIMKRQEA